MNKGTVRTIEATIKKYISYCNELYKDEKSNIGKVCYYRDGKTFYTNGHIIIIAEHDFENVPYSFENDQLADRVYDLYDNLNIDTTNRISFPDYKDLVHYQKLVCKINKTTRNVLNWGAGKPAANAAYIIDIMKMTGFNRKNDIGIMYKVADSKFSESSMVFPLYIKQDDLEIILMPLMKNKHNDDVATDLHCYDWYEAGAKEEDRHIVFAC